MIRPYGGISPRVDPSAFVEATAVLVGDVEIGADSSVWFYAVVRGDVHPVRIGARTNLQDGVIVHVTAGTHPTHVGDGVTVGHAAVLHGCRVGNHALVGMRSVVLDGAEVGEESLVGAGSVVAPGTRVPPRTLVLGSPARTVRPLTSDEVAKLRASADNYVHYASAYLRSR